MNTYQNNGFCKFGKACANFAKGTCRFDHSKQFQKCKFWLAGNCAAAEKCPFNHGEPISSAPAQASFVPTKPAEEQKVVTVPP
jgi:hypothetical protein